MIARITLNRPEKRNALNRDTILAIHEQLREAAQDKDARVILLRGEGKDFCSGADLSELRRIRESSVLENLEDARLLGGLFLQMRRHPLPVVAAVRGRALAGGCGLATAADMILASDTALFGYPEVNIGFVPAMVTAILRRCVSEKTAFELLTTGKILSAADARQAGMVNAVYPDADLDDAAEAYAAAMASRSASAVQMTKRLLYQMDGLGFDASLEAGAQVNAIARMTEDCRAGIDRFLKKE
ncbi:MAG TPA: enoyl-CoA hydratase/isomerase family protein [Bryobacteraceae bacterium]|nr:enoyl-CoA hydratase/isomerase family protein [Bryobacteraceae bacterium]